MASGSYSAGDLYLNIDSVATDTLKNLDAVIGRLTIIDKLLGKTAKGSRTSKSSKVGDFNFGGGKNSIASFLNIGKWSAILYSAKRLGNYMGKVVQYGADYTETLNLWQTAMGDNVSVATDFVNKMNEAYGISEKTLMNAQAIFKNMLGSLGQISDQMAYSLSEGITQMALDYASLYNVTFEQAFTKFQAALAGQVRPIRSVAGYDITETTLFQLYQSLGGTKTMRQLNRTEKQLLSIYAIFQQMDKSGAVGDLKKTIESFANQSRVMAEGWQRTLTYAGAIGTHLIEQSGAMTYLNALLIFMGDTLKAVAENMGALEGFSDPFESTTEGAESANDAVDELQGKLLGFDKFRSLKGAEENALGLDEKLLEALSGFDSILGNASMEAKKLAEQFKIASGLFDEDGAFNEENWQSLVDKMKDAAEVIGGILTIILAFKTASTLAPLFGELSLGIMEVMTTTKGLTSNVTLLGKAFSFILNHPILLIIGAIVALLIYLYTTNENVRNSINDIFETLSPLLDLVGDLLVGLLESILSLLDGLMPILSFLVTLLAKVANVLVAGLMKSLSPVLVMFEAFVKVLQSVLVLLETLFTWNWSGLGEKMSDIWGKWNSIDFAKSSTENTKDAWSNLFKGYANGGLPDKGSMFVAGEAGAEIVYNTPSGQSGVANVQQIAQATYSGTMRALNDWWGGRNARNDIPQLTEANPTGLYQAVTGVAKTYGKVWDDV